MRLTFFGRFSVYLLLVLPACHPVCAENTVLDSEALRSYVKSFNAGDHEQFSNIPNADAFDFLQAQLPGSPR